MLTIGLTGGIACGKSTVATLLRAEGNPAAVVEAALMVETGSWRRYDALLVVSARPEVQLARLMGREGLPREAAERWLATQMPMVEKERVATAVIHNDDGPEALSAEVERVWRVATMGIRE